MFNGERYVLILDGLFLSDKRILTMWRWSKEYDAFDLTDTYFEQHRIREM